MPVEEMEAVDTGAGLDAGADDGADLGEEIEGADTDDASSIDDADASEENAEESSEDESEVEGEQAEPVAADGRKMPDSLKKGIAALKASMPEVAKEVKGLYFANREYASAFAKPADAIAAKALIDQVGGSEGIQQIEAERTEWQQIDRDFAEAKPEFIKSLAEQNPEAVIGIAPHVINEWAQRSPEQYGYFANQVALNTIMREPGVEAGLGTLRQLYDQLAEAPWAQQAIASVVNGIVGLKEKAQQFEQKRVDPRETQLKQRETEFETRRRTYFEGGIADKADGYLAEKMPAAIATVVNGRKVDPEAMKGYEKMVKSEVERLRGEIPGYADKLDAHYRNGDAKASLAYIKGHDDRILAQAAKVIAPFLRNIPASKQAVVTRDKPAANGERRAAGPGEITLKEMPTWDQLDPAFRADPNHVGELMQGRAVLKGGKKASGWM